MVVLVPARVILVRTIFLRQYVIPGTWYLVHNMAAALLLLPVSIAAGQAAQHCCAGCVYRTHSRPSRQQQQS